MDRATEKAEVEATPTHCDSDYIEKALACAYKSENLRVESFHSEVLNQRGENFCSVIYRIKVAYRKCENAPLEQGVYILKDMLPMVAEVGSNEKLMFEQILPAMAQILEKAPLEGRKLSAECLFADRGPAKEVYLLEDLGALGYGSFNRRIGLTFDVACICVHKLAQFHAASMMLLHEQPELVAQLSPSHYAEGVTDFFAKIIVLDGTAYGADLVEKMPGMAPIAAKMRAQLPEDYSRRMSSMVDAKNSAIPVITHGDLWINNMMIDSEKKNAIFVDFQNCFIGSPAIDLQFLFYTSLQLDVLLNQRDQLLDHYYQSLCQTLKALNYPGSLPSHAQLVDEMERCLFYGYYAAVCELPICCASEEASEDFTVHTFVDSEAIREKRRLLFGNERVLNTLQATLGHFDQQGVLNTL